MAQVDKYWGYSLINNSQTDLFNFPKKKSEKEKKDEKQED